MRTLTLTVRVYNNDQDTGFICKVQFFWEGHKDLVQSSSWFWRFLVMSKLRWRLRQIFVAFSEKLNFIGKSFENKYLVHHTITTIPEMFLFFYQVEVFDCDQNRQRGHYTNIHTKKSKFKKIHHKENW